MFPSVYSQRMMAYHFININFFVVIWSASSPKKELLSSLQQYVAIVFICDDYL